MEAIINFITNILKTIFGAISKLIGSILIFIGLIGVFIEYKDSRLTSISGVLLIAIFLGLGYLFVREKREEPNLIDKNELLLKKTWNKIIILLLLIPFLLYLLKHNINKKEFFNQNKTAKYHQQERSQK